ncbi:TorF family putative porin [Phenylobacterium sp.]|uniref:TorF family putative porin n=1 Tax=Phenylobacterium sp. TaxID=1871053 RepID=UPI0035662B3C
MKALKLSLLAAAATLSIAGVARADDAPPAPAETKPISVVFNVGANTDYEFRGVSQTNNKASIFGGADATILTIGYAGIWLSNVDFLNGTRMEYDIYAGIKPVLGPVTVDLGVIRYGYTNQPSGPKEVYTEWKVAPSMAVGPATVGVAYFYSDDFFGETGKATYYEINGSLPIGKSPFSVSGALGHQEVVGPLDYNTWNLGVGYALNSHVGFDLRYWDTDEHSFGSIYKSKLVLGVKATFP